MTNDQKQFSAAQKEITNLLIQDRSKMIQAACSSEEDAEYLEGYYVGRVCAFEEVLTLINIEG